MGEESKKDEGKSIMTEDKKIKQVPYIPTTKDGEIKEVKEEVVFFEVPMILSPNFYKWLNDQRDAYYSRGGEKISISNFLMNWCFDMVAINKEQTIELNKLKHGLDTGHMYG